VSAFSERREEWSRYLPLLDAMLCARWNVVSELVKGEGSGRNSGENSGESPLQRFLTGQMLSPTVYWLIKRAGASAALPAHFLLGLMASARHAELRNKAMALELRELIDSAEDAGLTLVALKGLHVAQLLYGDAGGRYIRDIDVLVSPTQTGLLDEVFTALGYRPSNRLPFQLERKLAHATQWQRGYTFVDAHHVLRVQPGYRLDTQRFIRDSVEQDIYGFRARVPANIDSLLILLLSLCGDLERGVVKARTLVDIWAYLVSFEADTDWWAFFESLEEQGVRQHVMSALQTFTVCLPGATEKFEKLLAALSQSRAAPGYSEALDLLSGKPLAGRRWYMRHSRANPATYLSWLILGLPLRRWLDKPMSEVTFLRTKTGNRLKSQ
jgi:hypothetical protein